MKKRITRDSLSFYVNTSDDCLYGVKWWDNYKNYENNLFKTIRNNSKNYEVFIDIGSGIGAISLYVANIFPQIYSFDPNPLAFKIFKKNLRLNKFKNSIKVFNSAIYKKNHKAFFEEGRIFSKINFVKITKKIKIKLISLNDFIKKKNLEKKKIFIKIDIEGGEFNLLSDKNFLSLFKNDNYCLYISLHFNFMSKLDIKNRYLRHFFSLPTILKEYFLVLKLINKFRFVELNGKKIKNKNFFLSRTFRRNPDLFLYN
jgi:FkbM family methyltransferase